MNHTTVHNLSNRIQWIDAIKGFAVICVVLGHVVSGYLDAGLFKENSVLLRGIFNAVYMFHMPLFFIISGYLFQTAYCDGIVPQAQLKKKKFLTQLADLLLVYVLYSILHVLFKLLFSNYVNQPADIRELLYLWIRPVGLYWYLYVLIILYILFGIRVIRNMRVWILSAILLVLAILSVILPTVSWFMFSRLMYYAFFFYVGMLLQVRRIKTVVFSKWFFAACLLVSAVLIVIFWNNDTYLYHIQGVNLILGFSVSMVFINLFSSFGFLHTSSFLTVCGKYALELYLLHVFLTAGNRTLLLKFGIDNIYLNIIINLVLSIVLPVLIAWLLKKIGLHDLFFRPVRFFSNVRHDS